VDGYEHIHSLGQRGEFFLGLALDEDNQPQLSEGRIERWVGQVLEEFGLLASIESQVRSVL
jgi:flavodoxin I